MVVAACKTLHPLVTISDASAVPVRPSLLLFVLSVCRSLAVCVPFLLLLLLTQSLASLCFGGNGLAQVFALESGGMLRSDELTEAFCVVVGIHADFDVLAGSERLMELFDLAMDFGCKLLTGKAELDLSSDMDAECALGAFVQFYFVPAGRCRMAFLPALAVGQTGEREHDAENCAQDFHTDISLVGDHTLKTVYRQEEYTRFHYGKSSPRIYLLRRSLRHTRRRAEEGLSALWQNGSGGRTADCDALDEGMSNMSEESGAARKRHLDTVWDQ